MVKQLDEKSMQPLASNETCWSSAINPVIVTEVHVPAAV